MSPGVTRATSPRLLFLDADVQVAPEAISELLVHYSHLDSGLLSVQPCHRPVRMYEQLSAVFNIVGPMGSGAFALRRARAPPDSIRSLSADHRPRLCRCRRPRGRAARGGRGHRARRPLRRCRPTGRRAAGRGADQPSGCIRQACAAWWTDGRRTSPRVPHGRTVRVPSLRRHGSQRSVPSAASGIIGFLSWLRDGDVPWIDLAAWALAAIQVHMLLRRVGRFHTLTSLLFPLPFAFFIAVFIRSLGRLLLGRPVRWRGRNVPTRPAERRQE